MAIKGSKAALALFDNDDYLSLDKLQVSLTKEFTHENGPFTLCFWMYLLKGNRHGVIIRQSSATIQPPVPFLSLDAELHLVLQPLASPEFVVSDQTCPIEKWVHIGCELGHSIARLHMDGVVTGEKPMSFAPYTQDAETLCLSGGDGYNRSCSVQAFAHHVCALPQPSVTNHYVKSPPLELALDGSTGGSEEHEVEEGGDGVWSVVGGKASCRRNFALDVVLLDALGRAIHKDIELVASLVYADTGYLVEKPKDDAEAPLLTTFDGVEFPSTERPIKLVHGRASFKLKISQLSSKCDNRLFRVCFESPNVPKYPFLRVFSRPIRCVSRNRNTRQPSAPWKRSLTAVYPVDSSNLPLTDDKGEGGAPKLVPPGKVPRTTEEKPRAPMRNEAVIGPQRHIPPPLLYSSTPQAHKPVQEQQDEKKKSPMTVEKAFPDFIVFKYCLETVANRAAFLRALMLNKSDEEVQEFAGRVTQYTGCHHNGYQVLISKKLLSEGEELWKQVCRDGPSVSWSKLFVKLEECFCHITGQTTRHFNTKDCEFMQRISGSRDMTTREQFDRLWQWLYPVAMTIASPQIGRTWESIAPKWIHGMISRRDSEELLKGVPKPGTFIIRFAASRLWPHPDAGALVISYLGHDMKVNHRLLNLDTKTWPAITCVSKNVDRDDGQQALSELLSSQPELSRPFSAQQ